MVCGIWQAHLVAFRSPPPLPPISISAAVACTGVILAVVIDVSVVGVGEVSLAREEQEDED